MKRFVLVMMIVALAFTVVGGADIAQAKGYRWKISHVRPADTAIDKDMNWFTERLLDASEGKMKVNVFPASQLGDYSVVQERITVGSVEFACQPLVAAANKKLLVSSFPYLADSWNQAREIYVSGSPLMNTVAELLEKQNIKLLSVWPVYFGGIALKKKAEFPLDPEAKQNLKVRVPPLKSYQALAEAFGYQATPLPFSEAFTALQTGIVNGVVGSGAEGYYSNFRDVIEYYLPINTHFEQWYLIMSMDVWNDLSPEEQAVVQKVASELEARRWETAEQDQAMNEKRLVDYGVEVVYPDEQQLAAFATKARAEVWPQIEDEVGKDFFHDLIKSMGISQ